MISDQCLILVFVLSLFTWTPACSPRIYEAPAPSSPIVSTTPPTPLRQVEENTTQPSPDLPNFSFFEVRGELLSFEYVLRLVDSRRQDLTGFTPVRNVSLAKVSSQFIAYKEGGVQGTTIFPSTLHVHSRQTGQPIPYFRAIDNVLHFEISDRYLIYQTTPDLTLHIYTTDGQPFMRVNTPGKFFLSDSMFVYVRPAMNIHYLHIYHTNGEHFTHQLPRDFLPNSLSISTGLISYKRRTHTTVFLDSHGNILSNLESRIFARSCLSGDWIAYRDQDQHLQFRHRDGRTYNPNSQGSRIKCSGNWIGLYDTEGENIDLFKADLNEVRHVGHYPNISTFMGDGDWAFLISQGPATETLFDLPEFNTGISIIDSTGAVLPAFNSIQNAMFLHR